MLKAHATESEALLADLREQLFRIPTIDSVAELVRRRRFVIFRARRELERRGLQNG